MEADVVKFYAAWRRKKCGACQRGARQGLPKNVAYRKMPKLRLPGFTLAFIASVHILRTYDAR